VQPSSQDLELTARAVLVLRARGASSWTDAEFIAVMRARMTVSVTGLLEFLGSCGLLENEGAGWRLSHAGEDAFGRLATEDWSPYAHALLASGAYEGELARLLEGGTENGDRLRYPLAALPRLAPRAGALLAWDPGLREGHDLVVPLALLDTLLASSAMESAAEIPSWVQDNNTVGWRAELYSLRLERGRLGAKQVMHTSRDAGDGFGYDIETTGCEPRLIEVKGSRSAAMCFHLSRRELEVAREEPDRHELHFWGEIDLGRNPADEYAALRRDKYPVVIADLAEAIEREKFKMQPRSWFLTDVSAGSS
jgi:Protein NO VEIN, C-terminal